MCCKYVHYVTVLCGKVISDISLTVLGKFKIDFLRSRLQENNIRVKAPPKGITTKSWLHKSNQIYLKQSYIIICVAVWCAFLELYEC